METERIARLIEEGKAALGMELGSTRIKAVLIGERGETLAQGGHTWENRLEDGVWTYHLDDVWTGLRAAYAELAEDVFRRYGVRLARPAAIGVSAMMHGYLPFDGDGNLLCPFRTWRNTMTGEASEALSCAFDFNIPQRWSVAHLYQAILNGEAHVPEIRFLSTLAVYVHWKLTGRKAAGIGEASGMFPIDSETLGYDAARMRTFDRLTEARGLPWKLADILPEVLPAGAEAGALTPEGALLLDPTGTLRPGIPFCPPEGDAGTGMTATNSVRAGTGNVSAGTSVFAMIVLEKALAKQHPEIDMVTTPDGLPVAMVHCNTCTSDLNAWATAFSGFAQAAGAPVPMDRVYGALFDAALAGEPDCGGVVNVNAYSGEPVVGLQEGRPMMVRLPDARFTFENVARALVSGSVAALAVGMDILTKDEGVRVRRLTGHGGLFKTGVSGQKLLAAALGTPVTVMETAGEGGPWGMALLAAYAVRRAPGESLPDYLERCVFGDGAGVTAEPDPADAAGFAAFRRRYEQALPAERAAASVR